MPLTRILDFQRLCGSCYQLSHGQNIVRLDQFYWNLALSSIQCPWPTFQIKKRDSWTSVRHLVKTSYKRVEQTPALIHPIQLNLGRQLYLVHLAKIPDVRGVLRQLVKNQLRVNKLNWNWWQNSISSPRLKLFSLNLLQQRAKKKQSLDSTNCIQMWRPFLGFLSAAVELST